MITDILKNIFKLILPCLLLVSCADIVELEQPSNFTHGVDYEKMVEVAMPIGGSLGMKAEIVTKAGTTNQVGKDSQISGVMVFVYENNGGSPDNDKMINFQILGTPGTPKVEGETGKYEIPDPDDPTKGLIKLYLPIGNVYIYMIANAKSSFMDFFSEIGANQLTDRGQFLTSVKPKWNGNIHTVDGYLPMCGMVNNAEGACKVEADKTNPKIGFITYIDDNNVTHTISGTTSGPATNPTININKDNSFVLYRLMSKVSMNFRNGNGVNFQPKTYKFYNCPVYVAPVPSMIQTPLTIGKTIDTGIMNFDAQTPMTFTVYLPENISPYQGQPLSSFADRDRCLKNTDGTNQTDVNGQYIFENAPEQSTYVEITGTLDKPSTGHSADVRYLIHLGDFSGGKFNNFSLERDWHYDYNVTVNGVNDIIVEVRGENGGTPVEKNPAVEGIVFEGGVRLRLDAHYEQIEMKFVKTELEKGVYIYAETPYGMVNCKYMPKTKNLDPAHPNFPSTKAEVAKLLKWLEFKKQTGKGSLALYKPSNMADGVKSIFDAIDEAYTQTTNENYYTCFVDEYYYVTNPVTDAPAKLNEFVNTKDRAFSIGSNIKYSADGKSAVSSAIYMFQQRAIATFYDLNNDLVAKYGAESVDEIGDLEGPMEYGTPSQEGTDTKDGRTNTMREINNNKVVDWTKNGFLLNADESALVTGGAGRLTEKFAYLACLTRNRDHNGNGTIDDNEIRWYNPARDQVLGLWIGEPAMPAEAALYPFSTDQLVKPASGSAYPIFTSTNEQGRVVYGEQGSSFGNVKSANGGGHICVVRNLGRTPSATSHTIKAEPYYKYNKAERSIELYLTENALRAFTSRELAPHHERSVINRPYRKFQVAAHPYTELITKTCKHTFISSQTKTYHRPFTTPATDAKNLSTTLAAQYKGDGEAPISTATWRVPNQRELAIMIVAMGVDFDYTTGDYVHLDYNCTGFGRHKWEYSNPRYIIHCRTSFSNKTYTPLGYMYNQRDKVMQTIWTDNDENAQNLGMFGDGTAAYLCVRDVK